MKKLNKYIAYYSIAVTLITISHSCTERINMDLNSTRTHCVIYGQITTDTTAHKVRVTKSADYFSNKPAEPISGAILTISDGTNIFPLTESSTESGSYFTSSDVYGEVGKTYTLNVSNVDLLGDGNLTSYTASSEIKPVSNIDSILTVFNESYKLWSVNAWAKDPAETEDYYMFLTRINGVLYTDSLSNLAVTEDKFYNGSYTNGIPCYMFAEKDTIKVGYDVTLEICAITKDYFHFISEAQTMINPQNPLFSGPPANVRTNLNNDAIGYFAAYSKSSCTRKVTHK